MSYPSDSTHLSRAGQQLQPTGNASTVNPLHIEQYGGEVEGTFAKKSFMRSYVNIKAVRGTDTVTNDRIGEATLQAVVPGVCMMQILTELTSAVLNKKLKIKKASQAKFLTPIIPDKFPSLKVNIKYQHTEDEQVKITGSIHAGEVTFFKFKGLLA